MEIKPFIYFLCLGNECSQDISFYISFFDVTSKFTLRNIYEIDEQLLDVANQIYKEITTKTLGWVTIDDITILSELIIN